MSECIGGYISIINFEKFQHYKDRKPPWIKLYRDLLEDERFFDLSDSERYHLIGLFILASQHDNKIPNKPDWLKHQLRTKNSISLIRLAATGWLTVVVQDASAVLADCKQLDDRETEKRREETTSSQATVSEPIHGNGNGFHYTPEFEAFWLLYPRHIGKGDAFHSWKRIKPSSELQSRIVTAITVQKKSGKWKEEHGRFIPHPATWLNQARWDDEPVNGTGSSSPKVVAL